MDSVEVKKQLKMTYDELVQYLLEKYGAAKYDYFSTESCRSKNPKVTRTSEGLFCHHMDENIVIALSNDKLAPHFPFEFQKADRLVYCNVLEHLMLHIKIVEESTSKNADAIQLQGIGGVVAFLCPQINDYYNGYEFKQQHLINIYSLIENNFDDYICILKYLLDIVEKHPQYKAFITKERLSIGWDRQIIRRVYDQLR